jgi:hypothetical protein
MTAEAIFLFLVAGCTTCQLSFGFAAMLKDKTGGMDSLVTQTARCMALLALLTLVASQAGL